jgi:hypothetical protein
MVPNEALEVSGTPMEANGGSPGNKQKHFLDQIMKSFLFGHEEALYTGR